MPSSTPSPNSPSAKEEVELYQQLQGKFRAMSASGRKLATLVQPEGREWREFRNYWGRIISGVMMVGMLARVWRLLPVPGQDPHPGGRVGRTVTRFMPVERFAHWLAASSFIVLAR